MIIAGYSRLIVDGRGPTSASTGGRVGFTCIQKLLRDTIMNII